MRPEDAGAPPPPCRGFEVYEDRRFRSVTGSTIRPGGLALTDRAAALCRFAPGARVLDVGCGPGASVAHLRDAHALRAVGADRSALLLAERGGERADLPFCRADAQELPFETGSFEGLFCECVFSLVPDASQTLREFRRVLAPGGRLVLTDMYVRCGGAKESLREFPAESCLQGARSRGETEALLGAAGFTPRVWEDHTHHLRELMVRLIFAGAPCRPAAAKARPGYFLLIAVS